MATLDQTCSQPSRALVAKLKNLDGVGERYLLVTPAGKAIWVDDPEAATPFPSMREATRMAVRLPSSHRAFGLLREVEVALHRPH